MHKVLLLTGHGRIAIAATCAAAVLLTAAALRAGPVDGPKAQELRLLPAGDEPFELELTMRFTGGKRACIIARGDHKPVVPLEITVFGNDGHPVAQDKSDKDFVAAIWTPRRTGDYRVVFRNHGREEYAELPVNQRYTDVWVSFK